ncbi:MAG: D-alanyl-D-alanine carboxypeptidase/D-alanyl-D-alanine-endopeptidase [Burkholderiales bacterium]|nr:MAG: D-alanyl-D-alanine carboxypeptidase/D-alanyl-D-alanine-endopeptidase [Burkholderiales bacterium]
MRAGSMRLLVLVLLALHLGVSRAEGIPAPVAAALRKAGVPTADLSIAVRPVDGGEALVAYNVDAAMNPASTIKLVTTYAALSLLGPQYRWHTTVHLRGRLVGEVLDGDLVLRGGGDPKLVVEDLAAMIAQLRAKGLREIRGDLILDDGLYDVGRRAVEWFDGERSAPYNVRPNALLMNFKSTKLVFTAAGRRSRPRIELDPPLADVRIENGVRPRAGRCRAGSVALDIEDGEIGPPAALIVSGRFAPSCRRYEVYASVLDHRNFVHGLFKAQWQAAGGSWDGVTRFEAGAARGMPFLDWVSPADLAEIVGEVNKRSNNVMARHLLLQIAAVSGEPPATVGRARRVLNAWLRAQGLDMPELLVENGAGLSRIASVSAAGLARMLVHAVSSPVAQPFIDSLPIVGIDGTMKRRLRGTKVSGNAWVKTGSLRDVRAIAGYVDADSGRRYAVVMLAHGRRADRTRAAQDVLLRWVFDNG